jgi:DNA-binding transcriptional MerR regulator
MKLRIGNFARVGQVTVQTLRHYDDLDLLKPVEVDALSGYRYYTLDQLPRLHRILAFKDLGFSLEQIAHLLEDNLSPVDIRGMLLLKQHEMRTQVQEQLDRLERVEARLRLFEQEDRPTDYEVIVKSVEALRVASLRRTIPSYWDEGPLWSDLYRKLQQSGLSVCLPSMAIYHAEEPEIDVEVCMPVVPDARDIHEVSIRMLPSIETMACLIHRGSFSGLARAYGVLLHWVNATGYHIDGPDRAIYLRLPKDSQHHDSEALTEMQVPVRRGER